MDYRSNIYDKYFYHLNRLNEHRLELESDVFDSKGSLEIYKSIKNERIKHDLEYSDTDEKIEEIQKEIESSETFINKLLDEINKTREAMNILVSVLSLEADYTNAGKQYIKEFFTEDFNT